MTVAFRWLLRLFLLAVILLTGAAGLAYYVASRSLPDYNATHLVSGVSAPVEIIRDTANVPHIFGETDADSFYGLGFVHAQDRLWQMTMMRRTAQGRLSELFGARTVKIDEVLRRLDLYRLAQRSVEAQDAYTRTALEAYAAGVNAWIDVVNQGSLGRGAPEFFLFGARLAPWQPADSIAVVKLMGLQLSSHLDAEVLRARTALTLPPERLVDLLPDIPGAGIAALPRQSWLELPRPSIPAAFADAGDPRDKPLSPFSSKPLAGASNVWAAAPSRTANGGTLLANDPHLGFTAPSIWYLAHLQLRSGGVIGGTIPGMPLVLSGRNDTLGWGITYAYVDDLDVYIERLNPDDPKQYELPDGTFAPFKEDRSVITVKDGTPQTLTLQWTDRGPVLPPDLFNLGLITPLGHAASIAWTVLDPNDTSMSAAMGLMRAQSVEEGIAAGEDFVAPAQNLALVDADRIALQVIGAIPERSEDHNSLGRLPAPGWRQENHWRGRLPYDRNPSVTDPASGLVGNTNNKTTDEPFPYHTSFEWGDSQRIHRLNRMMSMRPVHSRESFIEAQLDTISPPARVLLPLVGADLWFTGDAAELGTQDRLRYDALALLADWNGDMNEHRPEPLIYSAWMRALQQRLIVDELGGPLAAEYRHPEPLFIERVFRDIDGASAWCNVARSAAEESCSEIARMALDDALVWISETYGNNLENLRWGDAHVATHDHEVLGEVPVLSWLVNIRQSTSGGDHTLMRGKTSGNTPNPFHNVHGAGYRGVYDMADPDSSLFVISTGQSGHPLSRFYDNLGERWRRGEYTPMSTNRELAEAAAAGVTVLEPADD